MHTLAYTLFTLDVCVCVNVTVKLTLMLRILCVCVCITIDSDVDANANADVKYEHTFRVCSHWVLVLALALVGIAKNRYSSHFLAKFLPPANEVWGTPRQTPPPRADPPSPGYYGIWSTSGRYASYWNAYLSTHFFASLSLRAQCERDRRLYSHCALHLPVYSLFSTFKRCLKSLK